ncbi:adenosine 3'-phospho 5'-phosphosulfate transporter 1-like [Watersipora subatra]|uniref:adenosine 3'-phospho 5'-phosphosulfate transporter 1-like n=1 Tax=Watersipora subatra TaxID=2589382 RepID=UPI00355ACDE1
MAKTLPLLLLFLCPVLTYADLVALFVPTDYIDSWIVRLIINLFGYATIVVPGALLIRYFKNQEYDKKNKEGCIPNIITSCVFGNSVDKTNPVKELPTSVPKVERTFVQNAGLLTFCFIGLQVSYLTWGLLQERIMSHTYTSPSNMEGEMFKNSQFLVFINRVLALIIGYIVLHAVRQPQHVSPVFKYSYCSFSNVMSSWFQYEALKFVSFPTQVICKASKVIPVMLMGKLVSKKTYQTYEYVTAAMLSIGVALFLFSNSSQDQKAQKSVSETTSSGILLMIGYMAFDSFTSNWQGELFSQYKMSSVQMMTGVNLFSCIFTFVSLIEQGTFIENIDFMLRYPTFMLHSVILSITSATGQLFIYYTISQFGPVTFIIIMTIRMALAILLSCIIYGHTVGILGFLGMFVVFLSLFGKIYLGQRYKKALQRLEALPTSPSKV